MARLPTRQKRFISSSRPGTRTLTPTITPTASPVPTLTCRDIPLLNNVYTTDAQGNVYFSDIPAGRIYKWSPGGRVDLFGLTGRDETGRALVRAFPRNVATAGVVKPAWAENASWGPGERVSVSGSKRWLVSGSGTFGDSDVIPPITSARAAPRPNPIPSGQWSTT